MRATAPAFILASILSLAACGGDDSTTSGGPGTGGTGGSGGSTGSGGSAGKAGSGGSSGGGSGAAGTSGSGGGGGQAGSTSKDAATPMDARPDTPTGSDATADRPGTTDAPGNDGGTVDTTTPPDGSSMDTSSPPDGGQPDSAPPADGSAGDSASDARSDAPVGDAATMVLTSTAFTEGMTIPAAHTCDGMNVSPPLAWTPGPAGTMSYAVVLTDKSNGLVHSGIYDIPASVTSLPMAVEKVAMPSNPAGSKQVLAYNNMPGYAGPCPGPTAHTYEFMLYAVDVATLPGVMTTQKGAALVTALQAHDLATTTLTGKASTSFAVR